MPKELIKILILNCKSKCIHPNEDWDWDPMNHYVKKVLARENKKLHPGISLSHDNTTNKPE